MGVGFWDSGLGAVKGSKVRVRLLPLLHLEGEQHQILEIHGKLTRTLTSHKTCAVSPHPKHHPE